MRAILGIYFSGTGNTKHCVKAFVKLYNENSTAISIEDPDVCAAISAHEIIVLGYPIYFSNAPKIVQDFITQNMLCFKNKKVFIIATMGLFSGDGAGCAARLLKKYGSEIAGGLHLKMPDCIGDEKVLKKTADANRALISAADRKISASVQKLKEGTPTQEGLNFFYHIAGLFGQRLWFYQKTRTYKRKPNVNVERCIGCGRCAAQCPMKNIKIENGKAVSHDRCTMCYRCFSHCPAKALTILGKHIYEQHLFENHQ